MARSPIHTVLFDLDGTLLDSIRLIVDSYHHALRVHGLPPRTDDEWLAGVGTPLRVQFSPWADRPELFEALIETYRDYNLSNHDEGVRAYPGVVDMVHRIRATGRRTGLVTSKLRGGAERGLRSLGLEQAMDVVIAADDVDNPKPHPEPVLRALDRLGVEAAGAVYLGDSVHDMESGRRAGVETGAVLWGPFRREQLEASSPTYWFATPDEVIRWAQGR